MNRKPLKATGTLNNSTVQLSADVIEEEADYVNAAVGAVDRMAVTSDQKFLSFTPSFPAVAVCWVILSVIMALRIYFTSVISEHNAKLTAENQILTTQNQDLESQRNNLTEQIQNMETKWNELNVSRAQWSIDAYCPKPKNQNRQCKACQKGWILSESSCYAINNPGVSGQKTWEEARENCRRKISDLVVKLDQKEKVMRTLNIFMTEYIDFPWGSYDYWIGLRVEAGNWTWINGTFLKTQDYWTEAPSGEAHCVISVGGTPSKKWKAVKCDKKHRWICEKKALSV
ncbi:C-type lectin domain family 10 member A-like [Micropterus salmoides]|uniref:C-type lectin domain family 10 member A-like n=1 Tax=Micropterus salmoides TaxID=27706 RepID=UPI0018EC7835|nr:C-type lectin domain family 10 member A-like [Micropterus salmoides]